MLVQENRGYMRMASNGAHGHLLGPISQGSNGRLLSDPAIAQLFMGLDEHIQARESRIIAQLNAELQQRTAMAARQLQEKQLEVSRCMHGIEEKEKQVGPWPFFCTAVLSYIERRAWKLSAISLSVYSLSCFYPIKVAVRKNHKSVNFQVHHVPRLFLGAGVDLWVFYVFGMHLESISRPADEGDQP
jgi:hypothetical protein